MQGVVKTRPEQGFDVIDVAMPQMTSHRVLIKVKATSICGSDLHLYKWDKWAQERLTLPPITFP